MIARILGPEEWADSKTPAVPLLKYTDPRNAALVVVEREGVIVASVAALQVTHFEGFWVDEKHRGNPGIMRAMLRQATALAKARGESWIMAGAADDRMSEFCTRLGGVKLHTDLYAMWVGNGRDECLQQ